MVRPSRLRRLRIQRALQVAVLATGTLLVGTALSLAWHKNVMLVVAGTPQSVRTTSSSVGDLLRSEGVPLSLGLQVQPPPGTALADGMTVMVSQPPGMPADAFTAAVGPHGVGVWVVEQPGGGLFGKAALPLGQAAALEAVGTSSVSVRAVVSGKVHDVSTNASTVGALLSAMGIEPDADDRVVPPPSTPLIPGITVRYDLVEVKDVRQFHVIPYGVHTEYTSRMVPGTSVVLHRGVPGVVDRTLRLTLVNGRVDGVRPAAERRAVVGSVLQVRRDAHRTRDRRDRRGREGDLVRPPVERLHGGASMAPVRDPRAGHGPRHRPLRYRGDR